MKQIIPLGKGKFVHLDSYGDRKKLATFMHCFLNASDSESRETRRGDITVAALAIIITTITVGAALGIDITSPNSTPHVNPHRAYR